MLELLSDPAVLTRACSGDAGSASAATLLLQACELALQHLFGPEAPASPGGDGSGGSGGDFLLASRPQRSATQPISDSGGAGAGANASANASGSAPASLLLARAAAAATVAATASTTASATASATAAANHTHNGFRVGDRVRDDHHGGEGHVVDLLPRGRCLVMWQDEDEDEEMVDVDNDGEPLDPGQSDVPSQYLALVTGARADLRHPGVGTGGHTDGAGRLFGLIGGSGDAPGGPSSSSATPGGLPGAREFWIGIGGYAHASARGALHGAVGVDARVAARESSALAAASLLPAAARVELAARFASRLLPALLAAQRVAAHEPVQRLLLQLVVAVLTYTASTPLPPRTFDGLLTLLGTTLSNGQSAGLVMLALQLTDLLVRRDAANAHQLRRHGLLRRVEQLAARGEHGCSGSGAAARIVDGSNGSGGQERGRHEHGSVLPETAAGREAELVFAAARASASGAAAVTAQYGGDGGGCSAERLAAMASGIARGDCCALENLAAQLASMDSITEYELEEARIATALVHFLLCTSPPSSPASPSAPPVPAAADGPYHAEVSSTIQLEAFSNVVVADKATRREAFRAAFLAPPGPPKVSVGAPNAGKKRRRGVSGPAPDPPTADSDVSTAAGTDAMNEGGNTAAAPSTPFAALLGLLHSTLELNEQLPVYRNLALGHQPKAVGVSANGSTGGDRAGLSLLFGISEPSSGAGAAGSAGNVAAKLAAGLSMLAAPLRLTLRRAPRTPRAVSDLAGASLHAGPLTPLAAVESHILHRVVVLDAGYQRWCRALEGAQIWLWIPGIGGEEDMDAAGDAADRHVTHAAIDETEGEAAEARRSAGLVGGEGGGGPASTGGSRGAAPRDQSAAASVAVIADRGGVGSGSGTAGESGGGSGSEGGRGGVAPAIASTAAVNDEASAAGAGAAVAASDMFGRWALAAVECYNPVTGRHACRVRGGVGSSPSPDEAGTTPTL